LGFNTDHLRVLSTSALKTRSSLFSLGSQIFISKVKCPRQINGQNHVRKPKSW